MNSGSPMISVIVPLFNEEENVPILQAELTAGLNGLDYEIIFVDDGSIDQTVQRIALRAQPVSRTPSLVKRLRTKFAIQLVRRLTSVSLRCAR